MRKWMQWVGVCFLLALAGCGGGGAGSGSGGFGDPRNGSYQAYAANGRVYEFTVNFDSGTYRMQGNGLDTQGVFTGGASGTYAITGNARFRTATDLVVGGFNFGNGVTSFVAARQFVTSAAELTHTFNGMGINLSGTTPNASRIFSSRFVSGTTLQTCTDNYIYTIATCPSASVYTYTLTFNGSEITGVDTAHSDTLRFRVARSGSLLIYLRAETPTGGVPSFRIGLPETNGLAGGTFFSASTLGNWATTVLTSTTYDIAGLRANGNNFSDAANLAALAANQPAGIRAGLRISDNGTLFVMQGSPLSVVVGANSAPTAGYIEIGLQ